MAGGGRFIIKGGIASKGEAVVRDGAMLVTGPEKVYHHTFESFNLSPVVTALSMFMGRQTIDITSPQPGFPRAGRATDVHVRWAFLANNTGPPLDWTLHFRRNQDAFDSATFTVTAGAPGVFTTVFGPWVPAVGGGGLSFAAGETYTFFADGPSKNVVLIRVILRFEELP